MTYSIDFNHVNLEWINTQMTELGLKNSDISRQTGIDKATLSLLFVDRKNLNLIYKALLYFYLENYRVSRKIQEDFLKPEAYEIAFMLITLTEI